jgi:beta-lactamase class A
MNPVARLAVVLCLISAGCTTRHGVAPASVVESDGSAATARAAEVPTSVANASTSTSTSASLPTTTTTTPAGSLQSAVDAAVANLPVNASVVAVDIERGERAEHLGGRVVLSASLYKLFVARELFRRIGERSVRREQPSGDGDHTVAECLRLMIVISDDDCGAAGLAMVGGGRLNAALHRDGFIGTALDTPQRTTANDVAELIRRERERASELYDLMRAQQVNDRMPSALPPGTPIAHKTGDRTGWAHDAGVITTPRGDLVVVVLTGPWRAPCCHEERIGPLERQAFGLIGTIARHLYDWAAA